MRMKPQKQKTVSLSTAEDETVALSECARFLL